MFTPGDADRNFGGTVAFANGLAAVGAPDYNGGSVHVYESEGGTWAQAATLAPDDAQLFGHSVALTGETVIVGAPRTEPEGAVYDFERTADGWTRSARLDPWVDDPTYPEFGVSIAYDGEIAVVGDLTVEEGPEASYKGSVFVFDGSGAEWTGVTRLTTGEHDLFGADVALSDDRMLIGAPTARAGKEAPVGDSDTRSGAVYAYERADGEWQRQAKLIPEEVADEDYFGDTVALEGTTAVVGAPRRTDTGVADVFELVDDQWRHRARLSPGDRLPLDEAGDASDLGKFGLAYGEDVVVVGLPDAREAGRAYTFERVNGRWRRRSTLLAADPNSNAEFGTSVEFADGTALVGEPGYFPQSDRSGRGYLFDLE